MRTLITLQCAPDYCISADPHSCIQSEALVACHVAYEMNKIAIFVTQKLKICAVAQGPSQWVLIYMLFTFSDLPITVEVEPVDGRRIRTDWRKGTKCPPARNVSCGDGGEETPPKDTSPQPERPGIDIPRLGVPSSDSRHWNLL